MPELRRGVRFMLFVSSYIPLFLILAAMSIPVQYSINGIRLPIVTIAFLLLCVIPLPLPFLIVRVQSAGTTDFELVQEYQRRNDMVTTYLLVYVFAFLGLDFYSVISWFSFLVFFGVVAIIQLRSDHLHVNPLLAIAGYDIYTVKTDRRVRLVISDQEIGELLVPPDDSEGNPNFNSNERYLEMTKLGNEVYITV